MNAKIAPRWIVVVVFCLAMINGLVAAMAQHQARERTNQETRVEETEQAVDGSGLLLGTVLALAALVLTALALVARPRQRGAARLDATPACSAAARPLEPGPGRRTD